MTIIKQKTLQSKFSFRRHLVLRQSYFNVEAISWNTVNLTKQLYILLTIAYISSQKLVSDFYTITS
jgi:hypothetical protein